MTENVLLRGTVFPSYINLRVSSIEHTVLQLLPPTILILLRQMFCHIETAQIQEPSNVTAGTSITDEQDNSRYYEGFDWLGVCNNPMVRNYITQQCDDLVTSDGNALTSDGKAAMETVLCPQGRSIIGIIEFAYNPIPSSLEEELASECGWS